MNALRLQIEELISRRRYVLAEELLFEAFEATPNDPTLHALAARVAFRQDDLDEAITQASRCLQLDPLDVAGRVMMFVIRQEQRDYAEAESIMLELIRENPERADFYSLLAGLVLRVAEVDRASGLVAEALHLDPHDEFARMLEALLAIIDGRQQDSQKRIEQLVAESPDAWDVSWTLMTALIAQHRNREALELGQHLLRLDPTNQALVDVLLQLRVTTHWAMIPLWPLHRFGWFGSAGLWAAAVATFFLLGPVLEPRLTAFLAVIWILYVVYSWVGPFMLRRWLSARGF